MNYDSFSLLYLVNLNNDDPVYKQIIPTIYKQPKYTEWHLLRITLILELVNFEAMSHRQRVISR